MKTYIDQIFNEGFGATIYSPVKKYIDKKIKKGFVNKTLTIVFTILYLLVILIISSIRIINAWPF